MPMIHVASFSAYRLRVQRTRWETERGAIRGYLAKCRGVKEF